MARTTGTTNTTVQTSNTRHTVIQDTTVGMLNETGTITTTGVAVRVGTTGVEGILEGSSFVFEGGYEFVKVKVIERRQRWSLWFLLDRYRSGRLWSNSLQARVRRLGFGLIKMTLVSCQWTTKRLFHWTFFAATCSTVAVAVTVGRAVLSDQGWSWVEGVVFCTVICEIVVIGRLLTFATDTTSFTAGVSWGAVRRFG